MKKYIKKHLKDEKRILKLMYKKGIFDLLNIDIKNLGWEYLLCGKTKRVRKGKNIYDYKDYLPQLHEWTKDYWGEGDSFSIVGMLKDYLFWETAEQFDIESGFPLNQKYPTTKTLINYLNKLRTVNNDSKFNKFLIINRE